MDGNHIGQLEDSWDMATSVGASKDVTENDGITAGISSGPGAALFDRESRHILKSS